MSGTIPDSGEEKLDRIGQGWAEGRASEQKKGGKCGTDSSAGLEFDRVST
jgi:hypothetical protein